MRGASAARRDTGVDLYTQIGAFLSSQGLGCDPDNYSFAYTVVSEPNGAVASAVARLTDGGFRLKRDDIEKLGGSPASGPVSGADDADAPSLDDQGAEAATLVAETHAQVAGFATMVREMQDETRDFGRNLAESAAEIRRTPGIAGIDEIARITGAMLSRIHDAEARLASATTEAEALRTKLAEANDTARRDALTGLANRRAFEETYAARDVAAGPYCLAVCDIDRFKRVNDNFGHAVGDRVLTAVGKMLAENCEGHDVFRHGGEEFVILLRDMTVDEAVVHLNKVREIISAKRFRTRDTDAPLGVVTISMGVTPVGADDLRGSAFGRADRLLYTAKAEGRDRVCCA